MKQSVESYLHKNAKELLYSEIENKGCFEWKTEHSTGFDSLIKRSDYRKECILMEFPTGNNEDNGMYPDEMGICKQVRKMDEKEIQIHLDKGIPFPERLGCAAKGFRFNNGNGYCCCSQCGNIDYSKVIIHDIAVFSKGHIDFAIEIINKHYPTWKGKVYLNYPVYIVKAENVLKRVTDSAVYIENILLGDGISSAMVW